jgi:ABC-type phosphate transport system substrate-binding protein
MTKLKLNKYQTVTIGKDSIEIIDDQHGKIVLSSENLEKIYLENKNKQIANWVKENRK